MMRVSVHHSSPSLPTGRFGGGWQWKVGFQASRNFKEIIINVVVFYIRIMR